jgi:soluble cytochrome b562
MRRPTISILLIIFSFVCCAIAVAKDETVDELKARFDKARAEDRPQLGLKIAEHQLHDADKLYNEGKIDQALAAVQDIVTYSEKARDAATQTKKHMKEVEIGARKMAEKLRDIKRNLAFEDQSPVKDAIDRLEAIRTTLLDVMFAKDDKKGKK